MTDTPKWTTMLWEPQGDKFGFAHNDKYLIVITPCCTASLAQAQGDYKTYTCTGCGHEWEGMELFKPAPSLWRSYIELRFVSTMQAGILHQWALAWTGVSQIGFEIEL